MAAADRHQPAERLLLADHPVDALLPVLLLSACRGHELYVLQPVPVRVAERELPEGVQTGVAMLARRLGVRRSRRGRGPGPPRPHGRLPVRENVQWQRHVPRDAAAHIRRLAVWPDHRHHRLHRTRSRGKCDVVQPHVVTRKRKKLQSMTDPKIIQGDNPRFIQMHPILNVVLSNRVLPSNPFYYHRI